MYMCVKKFRDQSVGRDYIMAKTGLWHQKTCCLVFECLFVAIIFITPEWTLGGNSLLDVYSGLFYLTEKVCISSLFKSDAIIYNCR